MVKKEIGVKSALELDGAAVCIQQGTTTELNLADYFRSNNMKYQPIGYETAPQTRDGFDKGACDVLTSDKSQLAAQRTELKDPDGAIILPEIISKEPLGPVVRQGDDVWFNIVKWVLFAMINAEEVGITSNNEEVGITSNNVDDLRNNSKNPVVRRILGAEGETGKNLQLSSDWAYNIIKQVGNYGESYQRNLEPLGITRKGSVNDLWTRGGILYAPPIR